MKIIQLLIFFMVIYCVQAQQYEQITDSPIATAQNGSRAVAFVDVNNDGHLDVFITNGPSGGQNNALFINKGDGTFEQDTDDVITKDNASSDGVTFGDIDNDGDLDAYIVNWYNQKNLFYLNNGNGSFEEVTSGQILQKGYSETASWADFDNDGFLDLYVTNSSTGNGAKNFFLRNKGDASFEMKSNSDVVNGTNNSRSVNWIDYDGDSDLDLFISNESNTENKLYNNNNGEFTEITEGSIVTDKENSTGSSWADYDNDGDLDLFVANYNAKNSFYRNDGNGLFTKITDLAIVQETNYSFGSIWGDIDNDGDLDLFVANASFQTGNRNKNNLYQNNGDGTFTEIFAGYLSVEGWAFGAAFGDYDNDGFLDLIVAKTYNQAEENLLYHNRGGSAGWVNFNLIGQLSNKSAIGAKVRVKATIFGKEVWQMREVSAQHGYNSFSSLRAHFGLGNATQIDEVEIEWPNGNKETFTDLEMNKIHTITEALPENYIQVDFKVDIQRPIHSSETVTFTNLSIYDQTKETSFEWDFDSDGVVDSNEKNPSHTYDSEGKYDVTLTVSNPGNSVSEKKNSFINVNNVTGLEDEVQSINLSVFPNPFENNFKIVSPDKKVKAVTIQNLEGKELPVSSFTNSSFGQYLVELDTLNTGLYILTVQFEDRTVQKVKVSRAN